MKKIQSKKKEAIAAAEAIRAANEVGLDSANEKQGGKSDRRGKGFFSLIDMGVDTDLIF